MKVNRPVNLDISSIKFPITAVVSILHRISGVILFFIVAVGLWALQLSLSTAAGFQTLVTALQQGYVRGLIWLMLMALSYHLIAGIRHLLMDLGLGKSLEGGRLGAKLVFILFILASGLLAAWLEVWKW